VENVRLARIDVEMTGNPFKDLIKTCGTTSESCGKSSWIQLQDNCDYLFLFFKLYNLTLCRIVKFLSVAVIVVYGCVKR